jgi:hypothetical protein
MGSGRTTRPYRGCLACRLLLALATLLLAVMLPDRGEAQTITASKILCDSVTCTPPATYAGPGLQSAPPGAAVFYRIRIQNAGMAGAANIANNLPAGFHLTGTECGPPGGPLTPVQPVNGTISNVQLPAAATVDCRLHGYFDGSSSQAVGTADISNASNGVRLFPLLTTTTNVDLQAQLPADLSVTKEIINPSPDSSGVHVLDISSGPRIVTYRITIANRGPRDLYLGSLFELEDRLSLLPSSVSLNARFIDATCQMVAANAQLAPASDCLAATPSQLVAGGTLTVASTSLQDFAAWRYPANGPGSDGFLRAGDKMVLELRVEISALHACMNLPGADGILETAHIELAVPAAPGGQPTALAEAPSAANPSPADNNTAPIPPIPLKVVTGASKIDPTCYTVPTTEPPSLVIEKRQVVPAPLTATLAWAPSTIAGSYADYELVFRNRSPTHRIRNIRLTDTVRQGVGTPDFKAQVIWTNCPAPPCSITMSGQPQPFTGYGDTAVMATAVLYGGSAQGLARLLPGGTPASVSVRIRIRYAQQACDSLQSGFDPIVNILQVLRWDEIAPDGTVRTVNGPLTSMLTTRMAEGAKCPLQVTKKVMGTPAPDRIRFGVPVTYEVIFANPGNFAIVVGTMIDTLRYSAAPGATGLYAAQLRVDYQYGCAPMAGSGAITGYPANNPAGPGNTDTVFATANQFVQQGVKLIRNAGTVHFAAHSSLRCLVTVTVTAPSPPASADPYCSSALLENAAILDLSRFYNSNLWPGDPSLWASAGKPMPDCYNWVVGKGVTPGAATWTWQGGGPLSWTYTVTNLGPPMDVNVANIRDWFTSGPSTSLSPSTPLAVTVTGGSAACNGGTCNPNPAVIVNAATSTPAGTSVIDPVSLGTGDTLSVRIDVAQAPATVGPGNLICNNVQGQLLTPPLPDAYWKNDQTLAAQSCIPVLPTAPLRIRKLIVNPYNVVVPNSFEVTVTCAPYPLAPSTYQIAVSGPFPATTIQHVPVGDQCTVTETSPPPLQPKSGCAFPVWETTYAPAGPVTIVPGNASNFFMNHASVINTVRCLPVGQLAIRKVVIAPANIQFPSIVTVNLSCSPNGPVGTLQVPSSGLPAVRNNLAVGSVCTITEELPPSTVPNCGWTATVDPLVPVTIPSAGQAKATVTNRWICAAAGAGLLIDKRTWVDGQPAPTHPSLLPPFFGTPSFPVNVTCGAGIRHVSLNPGNNYEVLVGPVAAPSLCTVEELPPPFSAVDQCTWAPFYTPGQQIAYLSGQVAVHILNRQYCQGLFPL